MAETMMTISGYAPNPLWPLNGAMMRMGVVERTLVAYFALIAVSMLSFGTLTLLSLLP